MQHPGLVVQKWLARNGHTVGKKEILNIVGWVAMRVVRARRKGWREE